MQLPVRMRRKRSFDAATNVHARSSWLWNQLRSRVSVPLLGLAVVITVYGLLVAQSSMQFTTRHSKAGEFPLLDGTRIARSLPTTYPNGDANRFECDLPSLRYQCGLNDAGGCDAYPQLFPAGELMRNWSPDETRAPAQPFSSVCRFNVSSPYEFALARVFHEMEVPFIAYGIPDLDTASRKWTPNYLVAQLGEDEPYKVHVSNSTHFMFFTRKTAQENEPVPYESRWMRYQEFLEHTHRKNAAADTRQYFYLMLKAEDIRQRAQFVSTDLAFLDPERTSYGSFFIRDGAHARSKGMRCRFGMPGIITEGHIDAGLNMVAMVQGRKRYIISPPSACKCLGLYTSGPSIRHTSVNWGTITSSERNQPHFDCPATEVIVGEGDVLYIPSYWYHHIVSLDHTIQCNVRSGVIARPEVREHLTKCGLPGF